VGNGPKVAGVGKDVLTKKKRQSPGGGKGCGAQNACESKKTEEGGSADPIPEEGKKGEAPANRGGSSGSHLERKKRVSEEGGKNFASDRWRGSEFSARGGRRR